MRRLAALALLLAACVPPVGEPRGGLRPRDAHDLEVRGHRPAARRREGPDLTPGAVAKVYFDRITSSLGAKWTDVKRGQYSGPKRTYPALLSVESTNTAGIAGRYDNIILLYLPDDPGPGTYFYSFFWTDIHLALDPPAPVTALQDLVNGFTILASPVGAVSRGCG